MRSHAEHFAMVAPASLDAALRLMGEDPTLRPIAGGTEIMVAFAAGQLEQKQFVSLQHLRELRFIAVDEEALTIGSGTTFSDLRKHRAIAEEFELLARAASWTGSVANQNRGTLGGNIANASPAADSPPALLVYEASVNLVSVRGMRALPYCKFHLGYKKTALAGDELVHSIVLPRLGMAWRGYIRKVGTRNAQAISKVALAGLARVQDSVIQEVRIGAASLREMPIRCVAAEAALTARRVDAATIAAGRAALAGEVRPIDDIRSTARYRAAVAGNLLEEFLLELGTQPAPSDAIR